MKKTVALALAVVLFMSAWFCGCTPRVEKMPDAYEGIRWISYDYSFCIKPAEDCAGYYRYNEKKYNLHVKFDGSRLTAVDDNRSDTELFNADWMYETKDDGSETLYVYNISFNTKDYEEFKSNYAEYVTLKQETI